MSNQINKREEEAVNQNNEEVKQSNVSLKNKSLSSSSEKLFIDPSHAKLCLKIDDGDQNLLKPHQFLILNSLGLENAASLRRKRDGVTHFGSK